MSRKRVRRKPRAESEEGAPTEGAGSPETPPPFEEASAVRALRLGGWIVLAAGAVGALYDPGAIEGAVSAAVALAGTLTAIFAGLYRDRDLRRAGLSRPRSPVAFPIGTALVAGGVAALLYPCFLPREELLSIIETYTYGPLVAVMLLFSGGAMLIDGVDRPPPSEPDFAIPDPPGLLAKILFFNPFQLLYVPVALFAPAYWRRVPVLVYLYESWIELDREAARERAAKADAATGYDWAPLVALCLGAAFLSLMEYFGHAPTLRELLDVYDPPEEIGLGPRDTIWAIIRDSPFKRLIEFAWWSGWRVLGFFLMPALVVKLLLRGRVTDHGLQTRGFLGHAWIYVGCFAYVLILVVIVSYDEHFSTYYPFYKEASRSWYDFWTWEVLYAAQFFSLEFFFRGFWLKAMKPSLGSHAIYAMVVPYCMIHFGKPVLETFAAILAGVVLGTLALRTRSIWAGFLIHVSVAISMDIAALMQTTGLPEQWWPSV